MSLSQSQDSLPTESKALSFPATEPPAGRYSRIRSRTIELCEPLAVEDHVVQPWSDVSPPKWHLGHTTWFFEEMILLKHLHGYARHEAAYGKIFNSYYKTFGEHWAQGKRGHLSRPTLDQVHAYRARVDRGMVTLLSENPSPQVCSLIDVGLQHEAQHQELLLMDIKAIFASNALPLTYDSQSFKAKTPQKLSWHEHAGGLLDVGHAGEGFAYDNEQPKHKTLIKSHALRKPLVTAGEYLSFIEDGGYQDPNLWLSDGWDWVEDNRIHAPMYWRKAKDGWSVFTLYGGLPLDKDAPVSHVSHYEADAFARWAGYRLPTEHEMEAYFLESQRTTDASNSQATPTLLEPHNANKLEGQVWAWTQSAYQPYPGFVPESGALGEYNGKFMSNRMVLRGGCAATPAGHHRPTYRNFYLPHQRWMFSGICLAKDI